MWVSLMSFTFPGLHARVAEHASLQGFYLPSDDFEVLDYGYEIKRHEHYLGRTADDLHSVIEVVDGDILTARFGMDLATATTTMPRAHTPQDHPG